MSVVVELFKNKKTKKIIKIKQTKICVIIYIAHWLKLFHEFISDRNYCIAYLNLCNYFIAHCKLTAKLSHEFKW